MDPSRSSQITGTTVNSSTTSTSTPAKGDTSSVTGKNQLGQQIRHKNGKTNIPSPAHTKQSPHDTPPLPFESVAEVKPQKSWLGQWFSSLFSDNKVEATKPSPKLPAKSSSQSGPAIDLEDRSTQRVEAESTSWFDSLPSLPDWLTGSSVSKLEDSDVSPGMSYPDDSESSLKNNTGLTKRSVEEVEAQPGGLWQTISSIPSWLRGIKIEQAPPQKV